MINISSFKLHLIPVLLVILNSVVCAQELGNSAGEPETRARLYYLEKPVSVAPGLQTTLSLLPIRITSEHEEVDPLFSDREENIERYSLAVERIEGAGGAWDSGLVEQLTPLGKLQQQQFRP